MELQRNTVLKRRLSYVLVAFAVSVSTVANAQQSGAKLSPGLEVGVVSSPSPAGAAIPAHPAQVPVATEEPSGIMDLSGQPARFGNLFSGSNPFPGDRDFPNFIGFISDPLRNFDPRSLTQMWPLFASSWTESFGPLPSGDIQAYGPGLSVALSERLCVGLSNGGYMVGHFNREREGWANLGGFAQYTVVRDVPGQFLATAGLIWEAPSGSKDVFQGTGPVYLAPYLTVGKELGCFHVLATTGYNFAAGTARTTTDSYYANLHIDRCLFGWLYPLVEFNGTWSTRNVNLSGPNIPDFIEIGRFDNAGGLVTVAPGFNAVLIRDKLEFGAVYETPIWSERNLKFNSIVAKMILRF